MTSSELFLIGFSIFATIGSVVVYNIDFSKWEKRGHE